MIDFHCHFLPENVIFWLKQSQRTIPVSLSTAGDNRMLAINGDWPFHLKESFHQADLFLELQHKNGLDRSIISPIPQVLLHGLEQNLSKELTGVYNDALACMASSHPSKLQWFGILPMEHGVFLMEEYDRCLSLGASGFMIGTHVAGRPLTHPELDSFWKKADSHGSLIFIHPSFCEDDRLNKNKMNNMIGVPWETTVCAVDLMLSDVLDRYSKVKVLLPHGGGFLPYQAGRIFLAHSKWLQPEKRHDNPINQRLSRIWYDTVVWDDQALMFLKAFAGESRVVCGTDSPFDLNCPPQSSISIDAEESLLG